MRRFTTVLPDANPLAPGCCTAKEGRTRDAMGWSFRNSLPEGPKRLLRRIYRIGRTLQPPPVSQSLPVELVQDCKFCASRIEMLKLLPHDAIVAELGTETGAF